MTSSFGAVDLFGGSTAISGTNLFTMNKDPTQTLSTDPGRIASHPETLVSAVGDVFSNMPELLGEILDFILVMPIELLAALFGGKNSPIGSALLDLAKLLDGLCSIFTGQPTTGTTVDSFLGGTQSGLNSLCGIFTGNTNMDDPMGDSAPVTGQTVIAGIRNTITTGSVALTGDPHAITSVNGLLTQSQSTADNLCGMFTGNTHTGTNATTLTSGLQSTIGTGSTLLTGDSAAVTSGSGLMSGSINLMNLLCGLCGGLSLPEELSPRAKEWVSDRIGSRLATPTPLVNGNTLVAGVQNTITTGSVALTGDPNAIQTVNGLLSTSQSTADGLCGLFTGSPTTGTNATTVYSGLQSTIGTGSTILTGDHTAITSGSGLVGGSINLMNLLCGLCGGMFLPEELSPQGKDWVRKRAGRLGYPTPLVSGASFLAGARSALGAGASHLGVTTPNPTGNDLATAAQGHLDGVANLIGLGGIGHSTVDVLNQSAQYHADALAIVGNPSGLGSGNPVAPPISQIPLLGVQEDVTSAAVIGGVTATPWFTDLQGTLGNPAGLGSGVVQINPNVTNIPLLAPAHAVTQGLTDSLVGGLTGVTSSGNSAAVAGNAMATLASTAASTSVQAQTGATYVDLMAVNSPGYHAVDPSLSGVFNITTITGNTPDVVTVTENASAIGFIHVPSTATKSSIAFIGAASLTGIDGAYVSLYSVSTTTGALTWLWSSANISSSIGTDVEWTYIMMPSLPVTQGAWYAAELAVAGSGSLSIVGLPNHWMPANTNVYPRQLGASRNSSAPPVDAESVYGSTGLVSSDTWAHTLDAAATAIFVIVNVTTQSRVGAGALPGRGALSAAARKFRTSCAVSLSGQGVLSAVPDVVGTARARNPTPHAKGTLSATARASRFSLAGALAGHGTLTSATAAPPPLSVKVGSTSMALLSSYRYDRSTPSGYLYAFGLGSPPTGAQTLSFNVGASANVSAAAVSYFGAVGVGPITIAKGVSTGLTQSVTAAYGEVVLQAFATDNNTVALSGYNQQALAYEPGSVGNHEPLLVGQVVATGSPQTFSATSVSAPWGAMAIPLITPEYIAPQTTSLVGPAVGAGLPLLGTPTYSPNIPWLALSSENVTTAGTFAPTINGYLTPGAHTYVIPFWASLLSLVGIGGGGGGNTGGFFAKGFGGNCGTWAGRFLERAVDFIDSPTAAITIIVAAGGGPNMAGGITSISWTDPSNIVHTLTCDGGATNRSGATSAQAVGQSAPNYVFDGQPYYGGGPDSQPGGGGDGAIFLGPGAAFGGNGGVWITAQAAGGLAREIPLHTMASGHGALSIPAYAKFLYPGFAAGHGVASVVTAQKCPVSLALPGAGTLTTTAQAVMFRVTAPLPGHGALTASAGFLTPTSGHGALTAAASMYSIYAHNEEFPYTFPFTFGSVVGLIGSGTLSAAHTIIR